MASSIYKDLSEEHPRMLIPELCKQFYNLGWVTGTGGGISIKLDDEIYIAPSGVQKERIQPDDLFIQNIDGDDLQEPADYKRLTKSQCTPLFMLAYREKMQAQLFTLTVQQQSWQPFCFLEENLDALIWK
ncbi:probable methylthioribulose-1-phosphate dehydratase isoform X3 [Topomyia yanbarensis]|uniref:probable methylthioribulose-1-phosphate dehydratase isoform X3 n=1 Tax=Topomyia yanbarensis TaxID=2498891 RepID=UPI00273B187F|nr:probable methylthioribulose-1-phosphate dehydratase isoform X3 [Topomyia yanbarensis]XP_058829904.1 probable methylthioribulose-1-phosphate dehydratase isoform X3 [Topomyia yanbarensis]XP_058829994.1 probable methylthioribulose-1-phosphate dehydratase isoform X3 [Topomyia yanbarensis]